MDKVDLHVHSTKSDGSFTPCELVDYAIEKGLSAFALTDHDTTEGLDEALEYAKKLPVEVIPGVELSTEYMGRDIHIVGIDIDHHSPAFQKHLEEFQEARSLRNVKMCRNLQEAGIDITYEKLIEEFPDSVITRSHYAKYLLKHGYIKNLKEAFDRYIGDHCKYFVPREKITPTQAVELILSAGGIPILAHPVLYHMTKGQLKDLVSQLKKAGLIGIEAIYSTYAPSDERDIRNLAAQFGLCISGGSDFHGTAKPGLDLAVGYGKLFIPADVLTGLREYRTRVPKIFFTDLDGTLLNSNKEISPKTRQALHQWMATGNYLVLSSGRPLPSVLDVIRKNDLDYDNQYAIGFNGGAICHCSSGEKIMEQTLPVPLATEIASLACSMELFCQAYDDTHILVPYEGKETERYTKTVHMPCKVLPEFPKGITQPTCKVLCISLDEPDKLNRFANIVKEKYADKVQCLFSNPCFLEVFPNTAGKGAAVKELCDRLSIPIENTFAAGDEENDISMLEAAGCGIAMCNGRDTVKQMADLITHDDNDHDGLAEILINNK